MGCFFLLLLSFYFFFLKALIPLHRCHVTAATTACFRFSRGLLWERTGTVIHSKQTIHSLHVCPECCVLPQKLKFSFIFNANKSTDQIAENCVSRRQPRGFPQLMKTSCFTSTIDCSLFFHSFPFFPFLFFLSHNFLKLGLSAVRTYYVYYYLFYRS